MAGKKGANRLKYGEMRVIEQLIRRNWNDKEDKYNKYFTDERISSLATKMIKREVRVVNVQYVRAQVGLGTIQSSAG